MISRKHRLTIRDFPEKAEKFFSGKIMTVKKTQNGLEYNRYAVIVSGSKIKKAVDRHLLKRRILSRALELPSAGWDMLFIIASLPESKRELDAEFNRIKEKYSHEVLI